MELFSQTTDVVNVACNGDSLNFHFFKKFVASSFNHVGVERCSDSQNSDEEQNNGKAIMLKGKR